MKFRKALLDLRKSTLPEWRDKFISYKELKQHLKLLYPDKDVDDRRKWRKIHGGAWVEDAGAPATTRLEIFLSMLEEEIDKFNKFFEVKEEHYVIKLRLLQEKVEMIEDSDEMPMKIGRDIVDLHGEMVLLENYSAFNYTGLVKILKKYEKRSGEVIRMSFAKKALQQPFCSTDVLNKLLKECEIMLNLLFTKKDPSSRDEANNHEEESSIVKEKLNISEDIVIEGMEIKEKLDIIEDLVVEDMEIKEKLDIREDLAGEDEESVYWLTISALRVLDKIRNGSSTVDVFSWLPKHNMR